MVNNWFNLLKTQKVISDVGIDFELPEKVKPKKEKRTCYQQLVDIRNKIQNEHMNTSVGFLKALEENRNYKDKKLRDMFHENTNKYPMSAETLLYRGNSGRDNSLPCLINDSFHYISPTDGEEIPEDVACFVLEQLEKWNMKTPTNSRYWVDGRFYYLTLWAEDNPMETGISHISMDLNTRAHIKKEYLKYPEGNDWSVLFFGKVLRTYMIQDNPYRGLNAGEWNALSIMDNHELLNWRDN